MHDHKMHQVLPQDNLHNNHHHMLSHSSRSSKLRNLEPMGLVLVIRGVLLDAALVLTHHGLLHGQVLAVPMAVDGLSPLLDMERFLHLCGRLCRPLLGSPPRAPNQMRQRSQKRRSMLIFLRLTSWWSARYGVPALSENSSPRIPILSILQSISATRPWYFHWPHYV